jgi:hypothetical protein
MEGQQQQQTIIQRASHHLLAIAVVVGVVLAGLAFRAWLDGHDEMMRMKATIAEQGRVIEQVDKDLKTRDTARVEAKAAIGNRVAQAHTPAAQTDILNDWLKSQQALKPAENLPDAPSAEQPVMNLNQGQLKDLTARAGKCMQCEVDRDAFALDKEDLKKKYEAMKLERDAAVTAAKGGSRWRRFRKGALTIGCAAAGAALGSKTKGTMGAAIGASAAGSACQMFF